jgi:hypothetical protein
MAFVLLVIGLLAAAIGAIMVGFGIPINEFSLGNTLIIAGTTALMGGLIVIALSLALRQLANLAAALSARPSTNASVGARPMPDVPEPAPRPGGPRMPMPVPARPDSAPRASRPLEPRAAPESSLDDSEPAAPPLRTPVRPSPPPAADDAFDMPSWRPSRPAVSELPARNKETPRVTPPERRGPETAYDAIWPSDSRTERSDTSVPEPRAIGGESGLGGGLGSPLGDSASPVRPEAVTVLKSGVVDGMAYTLYTDGSIEAELAQGVVRFGSIEELRNHLEKSAH